MRFTNPILYFFYVLGVIMPDWQLQKFTENMHKIAQNRVYNVQKLFAGGGGKNGKTWE